MCWHYETSTFFVHGYDGDICVFSCTQKMLFTISTLGCDVMWWHGVNVMFNVIKKIVHHKKKLIVKKQLWKEFGVFLVFLFLLQV